MSIREICFALLKPCCQQRGHEVDPRKFEIVTKWHRPLKIGQLWSFLGHRHVVDSSMHNMFIWIEKCERAYETIKFCLNTCVNSDFTQVRGSI